MATSQMALQYVAPETPGHARNCCLHGSSRCLTTRIGSNPESHTLRSKWRQHFDFNFRQISSLFAFDQREGPRTRGWKLFGKLRVSLRDANRGADWHMLPDKRGPRSGGETDTGAFLTAIHWRSSGQCARGQKAHCGDLSCRWRCSLLSCPGCHQSHRRRSASGS